MELAVHVLTKFERTDDEWAEVVAYLRQQPRHRHAQLWWAVLRHLASQPPAPEGDIPAAQWLTMCHAQYREDFRVAQQEAGFSFNEPIWEYKSEGTRPVTDEQAKNRELTAEVASLTAEVTSLRGGQSSRVQQLERELVQAAADRASHDQRIADLTASLDTATKNIQDLNKQIMDLNAAHQQSTAASVASSGAQQQQLSAAQQREAQLLANIAKLQQDLAGRQGGAAALQAALNAKDAELQAALARAQTLTTEKGQLENENQQLASTLKEQQRRNSDLVLEIATLKTTVADEIRKNQELTDTQLQTTSANGAELAKLQARVATLEGLERQSVKAIKDLTDEKKSLEEQATQLQESLQEKDQQWQQQLDRNRVLEGDATIQNRKIKELDAEIKRLKEELGDSEFEKERTRKERDDAKNEMAKMGVDHMNALTKKSDELDENIKKQRALEAQALKSATTIADLTTATQELNAQVAKLVREAGEQKSRVQQLEIDNRDLTNQASQYLVEVAQITSQLAQSNKSLAEAQGEAETARLQAKTASEEADKLRVVTSDPSFDEIQKGKARDSAMVKLWASTKDWEAITQKAQFEAIKDRPKEIEISEVVASRTVKRTVIFVPVLVGEPDQLLKDLVDYATKVDLPSQLVAIRERIIAGTKKTDWMVKKVGNLVFINKEVVMSIQGVFKSACSVVGARDTDATYRGDFFSASLSMIFALIDTINVVPSPLVQLGLSRMILLESFALKVHVIDHNGFLYFSSVLGGSFRMPREVYDKIFANVRVRDGSTNSGWPQITVASASPAGTPKLVTTWDVDDWFEKELGKSLFQ